MASEQRLRFLCIVNDFTWEALALFVGTSIGGHRLARELDALMFSSGKPAVIVIDNGTEMIGRAKLEWTSSTGAESHHIAPTASSTTSSSSSSTATRTRTKRRPRLHTMLGSLARKLHVGPLADCFFDPATALCLKRISEQGATGPMIAMHEPVRCPMPL